MILYKEIFDFDIIIMNEVMKKYGEDKKAWELFCKFYKDPDGYAVTEDGLRNKSGVDCSVDGILSIKRIYKHEGFNR